MFLPNSQLYSLYELAQTQLLPINKVSRYMLSLFSDSRFIGHHMGFGKNLKAILTMTERMTHSYHEHRFNLDNILVDNQHLKVSKKIVLSKPFCDLMHFKTQLTGNPKLLVVAPLAGHHSALLSDTVKVLIPFFDIYVTNWEDASMVSLDKGKFTLDHYVQYIIDFINFIGGPINVLAVCQPTVPVLVATSFLAQEKNPNTPKCLVLMAGPIDVRENPTEVNKFAKKYELKWFEDNVITTVPLNYPGFMRRVYPGFLQLSGFMSLHLQDHFESHVKLFQAILEGDTEQIKKRKKFYDNYFSVLDLTEEFYLQTIDEIFHKCSLPKGTLVINDKLVNLDHIKNTAILCVEGEHDDIAGIGQTKSALHLCKKIPDEKKRYHLQKGVGHYGVFSGSKFRDIITPVIKEFINLHSK